MKQRERVREKPYMEQSRAGQFIITKERYASQGQTHYLWARFEVGDGRE